MSAVSSCTTRVTQLLKYLLGFIKHRATKTLMHVTTSGTPPREKRRRSQGYARRSKMHVSEEWKTYI
ncbi:MAG: hypothetical protein GY820_09165 [Gammaproteobacteria bacterium]|nr:hypothetical protein [Gammaproteobacteria bacterium]